MAACKVVHERTKSTKLECSKIDILDLKLEFIELLAVSLPQLQKLTLRVENFSQVTFHPHPTLT